MRLENRSAITPRSKPGSPVPIMEVNLMLIFIAAQISRVASSGRAEISRFARIL